VTPTKKAASQTHRNTRTSKTQIMKQERNNKNKGEINDRDQYIYIYINNS
jgi:hypothetical protein